MASSRQVDEFAGDLAGRARRPGEGYVEQAARLLRARAQATEIVLRERAFLPPTSADGDDPDEENDVPPGSRGTADNRGPATIRYGWKYTPNSGNGLKIWSQINLSQHQTR